MQPMIYERFPSAREGGTQLVKKSGGTGQQAVRSTSVCEKRFKKIGGFLSFASFNTKLRIQNLKFRVSFFFQIADFDARKKIYACTWRRRKKTEFCGLKLVFVLDAYFRPLVRVNSFSNHKRQLARDKMDAEK